MSNDYLKEGQNVWVMLPDGSRRPAIYIGEGDNATFFGGPGLVYVVLTDTREGVEVEITQVVPRDPDEQDPAKGSSKGN